MKTELVTTLKRRATELISGLQSEDDAILITQHGKPAAYLVSVVSFDAMQKRMALLEGIARGERDVAEGRVCSQAEAEKRMARWLT